MSHQDVEQVVTHPLGRFTVPARTWQSLSKHGRAVWAEMADS